MTMNYDDKANMMSKIQRQLRHSHEISALATLADAHARPHRALPLIHCTHLRVDVLETDIIK